MFDKVKMHVGRHKVLYSAGTIFVISGVSYYIGLRSGSTDILSPSVVGINNKLDQSVITLIDRSGPPSWVTYCVETGEEWLSQRSAAIAEGIRMSDLSSHLNFGTELANGKHYGRRGLAA